MDVELSAEAKDKRLNRLVAITVVIFSICTGLGNIKDGNIVQAMQQAKADAVDRWGEYQATRTKLHIAETTHDELLVIAASNPAAKAAAGAPLSRLEADIRKYRAQTPRLAAEARGFENRYDAINVHDDQFDASEALIATAISVAAVAALTESGWLLAAAWISGAFGIFLEICGFAQLPFHPALLSSFLS